MNNGNYHPIRQKMLWVAIIQFISTGLVLAGFAAEVIDGWAQWLIGGLNIFILAGVLFQGTTAAEQRTTPLNKYGEPLNPEYELAPPS